MWQDWPFSAFTAGVMLISKVWLRWDTLFNLAIVLLPTHHQPRRVRLTAAPVLSQRRTVKDIEKLHEDECHLEVVGFAKFALIRETCAAWALQPAIEPFWSICDVFLSHNHKTC